MKTKKFAKKLALKKKTIANLSNGELGIIKGGTEEPSIDICQLSVNSNCILCTGTCVSCPTCASRGLEYACCAPPILETDTCYSSPTKPC
jgi:hypothetical protein